IAALVRLRTSVRQTLDARLATGRPLQFVPVFEEGRVQAWGDGTVRAAALLSSHLVTAGGSGVREVDGQDLSAGLPTLRAAAAVAWRREAVVALEAGGLY
ncbi:MAG: hypothetical protein DMF79_04515, partial [Acidobacteria bacterium]